MSDLNEREQLRDSIAGILELSRESWKKKEEINNAINDSQGKFFPRSFVFRALNDHPLLSAAAVSSVWLLGPAKFGAMAIAGASLFLRHRHSILPIAHQVMSSGVFKSKSSKDANSGDLDEQQGNSHLDSPILVSKPVLDIEGRTP